MKLTDTPQIPSDFNAVDKIYSLYGKYISSNYPMPLEEIHGKKPDVTFRFEGIVPKPHTLPKNIRRLTWKKEVNYRVLRYYYKPGYMHEFRFSEDGSQVSFFQSWPEWKDTLFPLMNPVTAAVIHLQGGTALHAASLVYKSRSTLIMGISGAGKSTLSAALAVQGLSLHSDDIAVIEWTDDKLPTVMAGYPMIKINPALRNVLELNGIQLLPIIQKVIGEVPSKQNLSETDIPEREKWLYSGDLPGSFHSGPADLHAIIILDEREKNIYKPKITPLKPVQAAMALTEHIYARDWLNKPGPDTLIFCSNLAKTVPVYKVCMPDNPNLINHSASIIRDEIIEARDG